MINKKVIILGTVPPPIGGVTIHTMRLVAMLNQHGIDTEFIDLRHDRCKGYYRLLRIRRCLNKDDVIHYQINNWIEYFFLNLLFRNNRKVYTVHSFRWDQYNRIKKLACHRVMNKPCGTVFIAPTDTVKESMEKVGFSKKNIFVLNTYLPITKEEYEEKLSKDLEELIGLARNNNKYVILANAYKIYLDGSGNDVYGLDSCISVCDKLKDTFFIFCSPQYDKDYLNKCLKRICDLNIYDRFKIYTNKTSLAPLYPKVDLFIRPTITDSYGISVEEALEAGIPAIASDTCERAEGAILYETGNIKELCYKVDSVMKGLLKATVKRNNKNGKLDEYLTLYSIGRKAM